ncbi:acyl-CoA reductase [Reichenbachiella versicolor]|uniref:acyl-CoA reductase n=1 Tax=Reichenbachiella versicolor TaxID=1821036 RepID=UPI000D6E1BE1|nr:acyl-CoA reductase [Reichenbachiella versicolor]
MLLSERIKCFSTLGEKLKSLREDQLENLCVAAQNGNSWFTRESVIQAIEGITVFLDEIKLIQWVNDYELNTTSNKKVGVIAAGNIPLVGFHDVLSVLIAGHRLLLKPSSEDQVLMQFIRQELIVIDTSFEELFNIVERLNDADAFIATGSDNSARYFQYYFKNKPHIIRANRSSVAVLTGSETKDQLHLLGKDVFQYYGLGCRNISKLFVPKGYVFDDFFEAIQDFEYVGDHHKYRNNYDYNKSIYLVNREKHFDNGFLLIRASEDMVSPISVLYFEHYESEESLKKILEERKEKVQCVVGEGFIPYGHTQCPAVNEYADGVDTLEFLQSL